MTAKRTVKHITVSEMGNNPQLAKLLQQNRWFGELPQDVLDELLALARIRTLQDGEFVYAKDDQPDGLYGVISGSTTRACRSISFCCRSWTAGMFRRSVST